MRKLKKILASGFMTLALAGSALSQNNNQDSIFLEKRLKEHNAFFYRYSGFHTMKRLADGSELHTGIVTTRLGSRYFYGAKFLSPSKECNASDSTSFLEQGYWIVCHNLRKEPDEITYGCIKDKTIESIMNDSNICVEKGINYSKGDTSYSSYPIKFTKEQNEQILKDAKEEFRRIYDILDVSTKLKKYNKL